MTESKLPDPKDAAYIPELCKMHQAKVVHGLGLKPEDSWQMTLMAVQLAAFRATTFDERFLKRTEGKAENFSVVLGELGCLACWQPEAYRQAMAILRHDHDWKPLFAAAFGKERHPLWPSKWTILDHPRAEG